MTCRSCNKNEAKLIEPYGYLPCTQCAHRQAKMTRPGKTIEFTTDDIKQQRTEYANDIIQTHRKGQLSKEWVKKYGEKAARDRGFTPKEIKSAKNVWSDLGYYKEE